MSNSPTTPNTSLTPEEREEIRAELIGVDAKRAPELEEKLRRRVHHAPTATFVKELVFWDAKGHDEDDYVYRVQTCPTCKAGGLCERKNPCWSRLGITRDNLNTARHKCKEWDIVEEKRGLFGRLYYRVNLLALIEFLDPTDHHEDDDSLPPESGISLQGSGKPVCGVPTNQFAGFPQSQHSSNAEVTDRSFPPLTPPIGRGKGFGFRNKESHEGQHDKIPSTTDPRESEPYAVGIRIAGYVRDRLKDRCDYELTDKAYTNVVKDAALLLSDDFDGEFDVGDLYTCADRLIYSYARVIEAGDDPMDPYVEFDRHL